jgi:hypothetical protein
MTATDAAKAGPFAASFVDGGGDALLRGKPPAWANCRTSGSRLGDASVVDETRSGAQFALRGPVAQAEVLAV